MSKVIPLHQDKNLEEFYMALVRVVDEKGLNLPMATVIGVIEMLKYSVIEDARDG